MEEESKIKDKEDRLSGIIGESGRWQTFLLALLSIPCKSSAAWALLGIIYLAPRTTFRCRERLNPTEIVDSTCYTDCVQYDYFSDFESTIISEWDLICNRAWLENFTQMVNMFGVLIGSIVFGFLADRFGRRPAIIAASSLHMVLSLLVPFSPNYWTFATFRMGLGMSSAGLMVVSFVIIVEIFGSSKREVVTSIYHVPLAVGEMIMPLIAYYLRSWYKFSMGVGVPTLIFLSYWFLVPESAKWLLSMGKVKEASKVMKSAAKWNKLPTENTLEIAQSIYDEMSAKKPSADQEEQYKVSYVDLFTNRSLRMRNLCSCFAWFILGVSFYGGNQYIARTSPNIFLSIFFAGLLQVPGMISCGFLYKKFGRRPTIIGYFMVCAVGNGLLALPDEWYYLKLVAGGVAVGCSAGAFSIMYTYTTELFPTVARNMAIGASSTASRIGSIMAPLIAGLNHTAWLAPFIFAVAPLTAAGVCFFLPETKGKKLTDRLDEM